MSDTGPGIRSDITDKIFDPYFTTKPIGHGSGLGLSVVYGVVKKHNGAVMAENLEGRGAVFHIFFPIFECESV
jgi:signal transduction histidine kinase